MHRRVFSMAYPRGVLFVLYAGGAAKSRARASLALEGRLTVVVFSVAKLSTSSCWVSAEHLDLSGGCDFAMFLELCTPSYAFNQRENINHRGRCDVSIVTRCGASCLAFSRAHQVENSASCQEIGRTGNGELTARTDPDLGSKSFLVG